MVTVQDQTLVIINLTASVVKAYLSTGVKSASDFPCVKANDLLGPLTEETVS